jgi:hypothetical protein
MPLRSLIALALVAGLGSLIVWAAVVLARSRTESAITRAVLICAIVILTALVLWIVLVLPAYWD